MATKVEIEKKKNSRIRRSRKQAPLFEDANKRLNRFREGLSRLEWDAKFSEKKEERRKALLLILETIDGLCAKLEEEKPGLRRLSEIEKDLLKRKTAMEKEKPLKPESETKKTEGELSKISETKRELELVLIELNDMLDACHFALERIAAFSDDKDVRQRAFSFVQFNPVAVVLIFKLTPYPDIRTKAGGLLPTKPDGYYETIGVPVESGSDGLKGISMRLLAHLRKDSMDPEERREMMRKATILIKKGNARWGSAQDVIGNLMKAMNAKMEGNGEGRMSRKDLADCIEAYLSGKPDGKPVEELEEAFEEVGRMR